MIITSDVKRNAFIIHDNSNEIQSVLTGKSAIPVNANFDNDEFKEASLSNPEAEAINTPEVPAGKSTKTKPADRLYGRSNNILTTSTLLW